MLVGAWGRVAVGEGSGAITPAMKLLFSYIKFFKCMSTYELSLRTEPMENFIYFVVVESGNR